MRWLVRFRVWRRDRRRGYTSADASVVRLKITAGIKVKDANLTKPQRQALVDIPDSEIWQLAGFEP